MKMENEEIVEATPAEEIKTESARASYEEPKAAPERPVYTPYDAPARKQKKDHKGLRIFALVLACLVLGAAMGVGSMTFYDKVINRNVIIEETPGEITPDEIDEPEEIEPEEEAELEAASPLTKETSLSAADVYEANVNSTVGIKTSITSTNYWGYESTSSASGSGFIFSEDGYIITNYHVVEDSSSVTVSLYNGESYPAEIIGADSNNDLALLKIEAEGLTPVKIGDSSALKVGEDVLAIGNPLGELTFSLTRGIVSALDREVTISQGVTMKLVQTDCAINAGNSGGALFNMKGEVVGITNAKYSASMGETSIDNIGFAIPINKVLPIINSIIENGYISKPYIGVSITSVGTEAQAYGTPAGASVQLVNEGSPAEEAGLKQNDIITAVNGTEIKSSSDLVDFVGQCGIGDTLKLTVFRQGEYIELTLVVAEKKQDAVPVATPTPEPTTPAQNQQSPWGDYDWQSIFGPFIGNRN